MMSFRESFTANFGGMSYDCVRSPEKESQVLGIVLAHPRFMQGEGLVDEGGNYVRVLDFIRGGTLAAKVEDMALGHEQYYHERFPAVLEEFADMVKAVGILHTHGLTHGDIRRDHILVDRESEKAVWIDFDFCCSHRENRFGYDMAGLGNVLVFLAGRGDVTSQELSKKGSLELVAPRDMNMVFGNRLADLSKVFPYIHDQLTYVLRHFSAGAEAFYESTEELVADLEEVMTEMG